MKPTPKTPDRASPEQWLNIANSLESQRKEGRLKIFLGMVAGVGKTYAMLQEAHHLLEKGMDVVVGFVETHGRKETEERLSGLPTLPKKSVEYRGSTFLEMDLDGILQRRPQLVLVDELAHTNIPGSRHGKRYMDVMEILQNGIDVYSTLNIQHVASRADAVRDITGTLIREIIPDSVLDRANEIVVIDLPPEEILKRLGEGKIYQRGLAQSALQNFFQEGNLTALREIALRYTAERVDHDLRDLKTLQGIPTLWKTGMRLMVAVYGSPYSERMIKWTRRLADAMDAPWIGAYIEDSKTYNAERQGLLENNLRLVQSMGGEIVKTKDDDIVQGLLHIARQNQVSHLVIGRSRSNRWINFWRGGSVTEQLLRKAQELDIYVVGTTEQDSNQKKNRRRLFDTGFDWKNLFFTLLGILITSSFFLILLPHIGYRAVGVGFLMSVALTALALPRRFALFSAIAYGLLWNFLFIPPRFTFHISHYEDTLMLVAMVLSGLLTSYLTSRIKRKENLLREREQRMAALYRFTRDVSSGSNLDKIIELGIQDMTKEFHAEIALFLNAPHGNSNTWNLHPYSTMIIDPKEESVASWVGRYNQPAGKGTDTISMARAYYLPLMTSHGTLGVLGIAKKQEQHLSFDEKTQLENFARQWALAIEREQLNENVRENKIFEESQKIYQTLLNSVSHELKTPLSAIAGSATALLDPKIQEKPKLFNVLLQDICSASERMKDLIQNLLDMSRIESQKVQLRMDSVDLHDLVGVAVQRLQPHSQNHTILLELPPSLPLIQGDFVLLEQSIRNIIQNAIQYSPPGTKIKISGLHREKEKEIMLFFDDEGRGLPKENPNSVFEKFYRSTPEIAGGTGLGLTISKAFVELHHGHLKAENRSPLGARFIMTLPLNPSETTSNAPMETP